jgi:ParB family chromosome partitioning protein
MDETNQDGANKKDEQPNKIKTREGSGYLKQLYSTARTTAGSTHSHLKNLTTFLVNFVPIDKVDPSELQVRVHFDESEIAALSQSIKEHGVLQPILVVQNGDRYKVIAGERRLRATKAAGLERIPARVLSTNDKATHEIALRENLDRVDLHPIEEGEGYLSLLEAKAYPSHDAIAKAFSKPKSRITECIGFTRLPSLTKSELLKTGVKNRALLRQLLILDPTRHLSLIAEATKKEEVLDFQTEMDPKLNDQNKTRSLTKLYSYRIDSHGLYVPKFRWKKGQDPQVLRSYLDSLKTLLAEAESLI